MRTGDNCKSVGIAGQHCRGRGHGIGGFLVCGLCAWALGLTPIPAIAETGFGTVQFENWGYFQKNENGTDQWKYEPKLYIPYRFDNGWTFTQRIDLPMIYTNATGSAKPEQGYSGGVGNMFIEEIFETPDVAKDFALKGSVRVVFPTGKQSPFGSGQYQVAPGAGFIWRFPQELRGVTLAPYVRYSYGFDADPGVETIRKWNFYPAATFALDERWSLEFYPENPITYDDRKHVWFVPLDLMLAHRVGTSFEYGFGGAVKLGHPSDPAYRYIIDVRFNFRF